ncbi:MAG: glutamate--tRNA ligase [Flavobacteriaceae bacterium]
MPEKVRVRFAPSPTGPLHIGGVRTALYNYLFARKHNGSFILRIEDTDQSRFVEGAEEYITEALQWCGIPFDEGPGMETKFGPYRQSERSHLYQKYAKILVDSDKAYYAFDTPEELQKHRSEQEAQGNTFIYNWRNREGLKNSLSLARQEVTELISTGTPYVIRYKMPKHKKIELFDIIRGQIEIDAATLDDKILFKSDGMPTYHLANVVDDHLMEITHVIRGEEWLPSLALHYQLYEAFGWDKPEFAHLPLILKPTGKGKLSKRDGEKLGFPVFPLSWEESIGYREAGYYPEAVVNFLALLGWNPGDEREILSLEELVGLFSLDRVHKAGARFDPDKTKWYNHHYLQQRTEIELVADLKKNTELELHSFSDSYLEKVVGLLKDRADFALDIWTQGRYFFSAPENYNEKAAKKHWKDDTADLMSELADIIRPIEDFSTSKLENEVKSWIEQKGVGFGKIMAPLRLALVGDLKGPGLFDIMELIGKQESTARIEMAVQQL